MKQASTYKESVKALPPRWARELAEIHSVLRAEAAALDEARAELERLRADQRRYQFLAALFEPRRNGWWIDSTLIGGDPESQKFAAVIDAAIKAQE